MDNWQFWLVAVALTAAVAATLIRVLWRETPPVAQAAAFDVQVYKDQLAEIERDVARGTLAADEAARLRVEVSRRLLDADRALALAPAIDRRGGLGLASLATVLLVLLGAGLYLQIGAPGYPDLPLAERLAQSEVLRAARPSQEQAEAQAPTPPAVTPDPQFAALMDQLRAAVKDRPDDLRGLELLAGNEMRLGNLVAARQAMDHLVAVKGQAATAEDLAALAEAMIMAAGGRVTPEAEAVLTRALQKDPKNGTALFYSGVLFAQIGRFDQTFRLWAPLLEESPADAPWIAPIRQQIEDIAWRAGEKYTLPPAAGDMPGPDGAAMAAAADMSDADRQAMIEGMVAKLDARLQSEGGSPEEWARLVNALAQLGRKDEAQAAYQRGKAALAGDSVGLGGLRETATLLGLAP